MALKYNVDEVLEMGQQIERNGRRFYVAAAGAARNEQVKALLQRLADMEARHEVLFGQMRAEAAQEGIPHAEFDPDFEVGRYLQCAADSHVFNVHKDLSEKLTGRETPQQVLKTALGFEKDTVVLFLGIKELVPAELGKSRMDTLIKEEMSHIVDISSQLHALQK
jgi:rubrerythrin